MGDDKDNEKDVEIVNFIIAFFAIGIVFAVYYPALFMAILWIVAFVGAVYLLLGIISRVISGLAGKKYAWYKDWWHGLAILLMVGLIFGRMDIAVGVIWWFIDVTLKLFAGILTFHL